MRFVVNADTSTDPLRLGAKAAALAELERAGFPVPPWFVISPDAFRASMRDAAHTGEAVAADAPLAQVTPTVEVRAALARAVARLCPDGEALAVRSSMPEEDGATRSFAGQFESYLGVPAREVAERVTDVWRSAFGHRVAHYRIARRVAATGLPTVLVQRMVAADAAGVAFSADPVNGRRSVAVVSAVTGLGCGLVDGGCDADHYHIDREGRIARRSIAHKRVAHRLRRGPESGVEIHALPDDAGRLPAISDDQARAVAELARRCARHFGAPQDIEWAIARGRLYLLQSRPITCLAQMPDPDGRLAVWDNSNIAESYCGVTTPLTFSFVRYAYAHVYRQLCRIGGVDEATIAANEPAFRSLIGLVRGRIHYNLLSWYQLLALTPGFRYNRGFLDRMLGLREEVRPQALDGLDCRPGFTALRRLWSMAVVAASAMVSQITIGRRIARFDRRVGAALEMPDAALENLRLDELVAAWHELDRRLLRHWDAPLVNDYLAMFFHGALERLVERWFSHSERGIANNLLSGERGVISVEPAARLREMADVVSARPPWAELLCRAPLHVIHRKMEAFPELRERYRAYLAAFGDRCLEELKLESPTLHDDPAPLLRSVGELARAPRREPSGGGNLRTAAERRVREVLGGGLLRRALFRWILRNARARLRDRENLRFARTRVFGRVRRLFVEVGKRLHALGVLDAPRDVFYLEVDEVLGFVDGTATCVDLRGLATVREAEFARYRRMQAPPERFETRGAVHHGHTFRASPGRPAGTASETRSGQPCSSGHAQGRARIVHDPRGTRLEGEEILVAERTDPGWVVLFSGAAGLVVERGSLLSHSAIVARELGIPAVFGVPGASEWLRDGDWIELDGGSGTVRRLRRSDEEQAA